MIKNEINLFYFIFLLYRLSLNSNYGIEFIFLSNLFELLQISESLNII
jgi:hypothetical protein